MLYFWNDYQEGAHPEVLAHLIDTNFEPLPGYGEDSYSMAAAEKIKAACECPEAEVRFLAGGTQTNVIVVDSMLKSYEGVVSAQTGHVNVHEAGAVEASGHKVLTVPHNEGKLCASDVDTLITDFYADENHEHMVFPGMVYVSHPTEYGTLYTKAELEEIAAVCHKWEIPLYLDGARLAYALASPDTDLTLPDIARICDVFYIGGTKCGALCGEAVVFTKGNMPPHFTAIIKSHLALGAKGRLTGIQFDALFTNDLYFRIGKRAIDTAMRMKELMTDMGYRLYLDSPTNQQFFIIENSKVEDLYSKVACGFMDKYDDEHSVIRLCTSWATDMKSVEALAEIL